MSFLPDQDATQELEELRAYFLDWVSKQEQRFKLWETNLRQREKDLEYKLIGNST